MKSQIVAFLTALTFILHADVSSAENISRVEVVGNERIEADTIIRQVQSLPGSEVSQEKISNDIKQIYRTGYFDSVDVNLKRTGADTAVVFQVREKPSVRNVFLKGNEEVSDDTLKEKFELGPRRFLDRRKIRAALDQIKVYYQQLGYYDVDLDFEESAVENNQVDITIKVDEKEKVRIREVVFEGRKQVEEDDLLDVIKSSDYTWYSSWITGTGTVKPEQLETDTKELTRVYLNHGFIDARIAQPEIIRIEDGVKLVFKITEGEPYTLSAVDVSGDLIDGSAETTLEGIQSKAGDTFNADQLRKDTFTVSEKFTDRGYAFANVNPDTSINRDARTVGIEFQVQKGKEIEVDRINITGNQKTQDNVIRRNLRINEQEQFSSSKIRRSQELLQRLGYFDEVTITPEPSGEEGKVDLNVGVREANTGSFSVGAGVSSGEGFIFSTQVSENNVFGSGNSLTLDLSKGQERDTYILGFNNPRVYDSFMSWGVDGQSVRRGFNDFDREDQGGSTTIGYPLWFLGDSALDDIRASISYELMNHTIDDIDTDAAEFIRESEGSAVSSSFTPRLIRNTLNNPIDPTAGSRQLISMEYAGIGGDDEFYIASAQNTFFYNFWDSSFGPWVFGNRLRLDYGESLDDDERLPLYRRFFPGGINSVRGFDVRTLGPKDNGSEFGGSQQFVANFELIFPIANSIGLKGVVFYDMGEAFDDDANIEFGELRQAYGWGIRWRSPIAPIRIEFGYPVDREEGEDSFVTNFSFGAPF